jgi:hypothetical protein
LFEQRKINIKIAEIQLEAVAEAGDWQFRLYPGHHSFQVPGGEPDIKLRYYYGPIPDIALAISQENLVFASGGLWGCYRHEDRLVFALAPVDYEAPPYRVVIMDADLREGDVFTRPLNEALDGRSTPYPAEVAPFEYPLDELLMVNFLSRGRGVILHASGVGDAGQGLLFVGVSGAGKSTLAELWSKMPVTLLSDDRIIVRRKEGRLRMYGTPWHGDALISSPDSTPVERIYFIQHAPKNYVEELTPADATARLLVRCFPPFYDKAGMEFTLDFLGQIAQEMPCYELGFVPDAGIIDFVRGRQ